MAEEERLVPVEQVALLGVLVAQGPVAQVGPWMEVLEGQEEPEGLQGQVALEVVEAQTASLVQLEVVEVPVVQVPPEVVLSCLMMVEVPGLEVVSGHLVVSPEVVGIQGLEGEQGRRWEVVGSEAVQQTKLVVVEVDLTMVEAVLVTTMEVVALEKIVVAVARLGQRIFWVAVQQLAAVKEMVELHQSLGH